MDPSRATVSLLDLLHAHTGLVCLVGAGGKKTTLYHLAAVHPGRIGITSTVHTHYFPNTLEATQVIADPEAIFLSVTRAAVTARVVAFGLRSTKYQRLAGLPPLLIAQIHEAAGFDVTLIKCDGARGRRIKAPGADEPPIPANACTVIPVVSARAIGQPLSERIAHRVECFEEVTGARPGDIITPEHIARLLASEQGALKDVGRARVSPLINMADNVQFETLAREAASRALELTDRFARVVISCMRRANPLVAVIER